MTGVQTCALPIWETRVDGMLHNEVNIAALNKAVEKLQSDVEKLKDKQREFGNGNSH